jgi:hypothetical protein
LREAIAATLAFSMGKPVMISRPDGVAASWSVLLSDLPNLPRDLIEAMPCRSS